LLEPGRHHAGIQGLYLYVYVSPDAQVRRWIFRYTSPVTRRVTETGLGLFPAVAPNDAKSKALSLQKQIAQGICPIQAKRVAVVWQMSFGECCEAWIETHKPGWRSESQLKNAKTLLGETTVDCICKHDYTEPNTGCTVKIMDEVPNSSATCSSNV
jgi:hypothetical protein